MAFSSIEKFDFTDERYIAGSPVSSSSGSDSSIPFEYEVVFPPEYPVQEQLKLIIDPTGQSGQISISDVLVTYGGVFEGDSSSIVITGNGLSDADKDFIRQRISLINLNGNKDLLIINAKDIGLRAPNGIQLFDLHISYVEQEIQYVPSEQSVNMISISHNGDQLPELSISVSGSPPVVTIDGGNPEIIVSSIGLKSLIGGFGSSDVFVNVPASSNAINFDLHYDLNNTPGIRIIDNFPIRPYNDGDFSNFVYTKHHVEVTDNGSTKNFVVNITREVRGPNPIIWTMIADSSVWASIGIQNIELSSYPDLSRRFDILGTLTSNTIPSIALSANSSSFQYKIEKSASEVTLTIKSGATQESASFSIDSPLQDIVNYDWFEYFGAAFSIQIANNIRNLPVDFLDETVGFESCGFPINNPIYHNLTLNGSSRLTNFAIDATDSESNYTGNILDVLLNGNSIHSPYDGYGMVINQICGNDWLDTPAYFLPSFGLIDFSGGNTISVSHQGENYITGTSIGFLYTSTIQEVSENLQFILDVVNGFANIFISPNPGYSYLSCQIIKNGNFVSPVNISSILNILMTGSIDEDVSLDLSSSFTMGDLRNSINNHFSLKNAVYAYIVNGHGLLPQTSLIPLENILIPVTGLNLKSITVTSINFTYSSATYISSTLLSDAINIDFSPYGVSAVSLGSFKSKDLNTLFPGVNLLNTTVDLLGTVLFDPQPPIPSVDLVVKCNIKYSTGSNPGEEKGLQVAIGGYESKGVFYPNSSPNAFFEPVYNTIFPIEFTLEEAEVVYLLTRTRLDLDGLTYLSNEDHYDGRASYSNGMPSQFLMGYKPTDSSLVDIWMEDFGMPTVLAIPLKSSTTNVMIQDTNIVDSLSLIIRNLPSAVDNFGFLAINRSNLKNSQISSRGGRSYGLVLDNRGVWDILISPEASMEKSNNGQFSHLGSFYLHELEDADESWDLTILNGSDLPSAINNSISLIPVPGYPRVWILRIDPGVKQYLKSERKNAPIGSNNGCSVYIDILAKGRETGVQGTCRIYIYYDYTCVYEFQLCDFVWNLTNPPVPTGPQIINGNLEFLYEQLIDCSLIDFDGSGSFITNIDALTLTSVQNVPTFKNGNALLLMKGQYTAEVRGFFFPTVSQLDDLQFNTCEQLSGSIPLALRINRENLWLPNGEVITDINEIRFRITQEPSYMWIRPSFQFPPDDIQKECSPDEIVIVAIGYQFKNWTPGTREEKFIFGSNLELSVGIIAAPQISLCYKFYYNQTEG